MTKKSLENKLEMTVKRIDYKRFTQFLIDTLSTYDFKTVEIQTMSKDKIYGLYSPDEKIIYKNIRQDIYETKKSILHELMHLYSDKEELNWNEDTVEAMAIGLYKKIYKETK